MEDFDAIEEMNLEGRLRFEAAAMRAAIEGRDTPGTFHNANWQNKPHRVVFDAANLMEKAADRIAGIA